MAMINLMQDAEPNFKSKCSPGMVIAAEKHAPGKRPHIDTLFDVLKGAGNYVRDDVIFNTIQLVSETPDLHSYVVHEAWKEWFEYVDALGRARTCMKSELTEMKSRGLETFRETGQVEAEQHVSNATGISMIMSAWTST